MKIIFPYVKLNINVYPKYEYNMPSLGYKIHVSFLILYVVDARSKLC